MLVYLAGHPAKSGKFAKHTLPLINNHLTTFADQGEIQQKITYGNFDKNTSLLIDSGAYSAYASGKIVVLEEYAEWIEIFRARWQPKLKDLGFFTLDVIQDAQASDKNLKWLTNKGINVIPIYTYKADIAYLHRYLKDYPYIALGGVVGIPRTEIQDWFDYCFKSIIRHYKKTGKMPKIHLLGVTQKSFLQRYPAYSCDSSAWVKSLRYGQGEAIGKRKVPRYKTSDEAYKIAIAVLKAEINKYQTLEADITRFWANRGIEFN